MTVLQGIFLVTGAATLISAVMVVSSPRLVHAALWLVLSLAGVSVVFVLLEANFLAVVQVAIYIGAIAILIIFAVMLTRRVMADSGPQLNSNWWLAFLTALLFFGGLVFLFFQAPELALATPSVAVDQTGYLQELGLALVDLDRYLLPFEVASILLLAAMIGAIIIARPPVGPDEGGEA
jgi:NADH-quinone oxidoreductase subunit J